MNIYNFKDEIAELHILDPDYITPTLEIKSYNYFKGMSTPHQVRIIIGVYIQYEIINYSFDNYQSLYQITSQAIQSRIDHYMNIGHAHLLNDYSNTFFITMFNVNEKSITDSFLDMYKNVINENFLYQKVKTNVDIKCGVYFANSYIRPYELYELSKEQYENTIHHESVISIQNSMLLK